MGAVDVTPRWDGEDVVLAESIFGTADPVSVRGMIAAWWGAQFGVGVDHLLSFEMSVGAAAGVRLADGSAVFLKSGPPRSIRSAWRLSLRSNGCLPPGASRRPT